MVRHGDDQWFDLVKWVLFAMIDAEELGVTQKNVDEMAKSDKPELKRAFGTDGNLGEQLGLTKDWVITDRQGGRQLRRILRPQRRRRLEARNCPRPQSALEQGRNSVRAADPLIAASCGDDQRAPTSPRRSLSPGCGARSAVGQGGEALSFSSCSPPRWSGFGYEIVANARANLQSQRITVGLRVSGEYGRL